ncbi:molybdopterin molybdotransferase MoeA [Novosphingobium sp.]|uniref:molybdopterin molybdotransferase MoeA n=1 Tax=Novosphingobium sp. TaxID=1874826 RepID=UPI0025D26841|nr:molybdopterin molybdotransferase MoeA [Novosphingobium sp.]
MSLPNRPAPLPLAEAQARLLALAPTMPIEHRPAAECNGFYTAHPVHSRRNQPAVALSAMDGYALRAADLPGPWQVIGESAAGRPFAGSIGAGQAVRISTGAAVPAGADCVLIQEDAERDGDRLLLTGTSPQPASRHIRPQAMDFADDALLLPTGTRLNSARIALAIAGGHNLLAVRGAPSVAIIDSGDELVPAGQPAGDFGLPASNGAMLAAMVAELPCRVTCTGPVADRLDALVAAFEAHADADVIVTSGGASVGEHDLIRPALARIGAELEFWRVAIKPGKPLLIARKGRQLIVGLPGNPASAYVTAWLFLLPVLRAAMGAAKPLPHAFTVPLAAPLAAGGGRMEFIRARWNGETVMADTMQDSGAIGPLARANALIEREMGAPPRAIGEQVRVFLLDNGAFA